MLIFWDMCHEWAGGKENWIGAKHFLPKKTN